MPNYEDRASKQIELIRKALAGSVFVADMTTALPASLTTGAEAELAALPDGYTDLGWMSKEDGATWSRESEVSEVTSWGSFEPTRRDINQDVTGLQVTAQETKLKTLELYNSVDLSAVAPDSVTGEVAFSQPTQPAPRYYRVLAIAVDGVGSDAIYLGRLLQRANITERGEQVWSDGDDPIAYQSPGTSTSPKPQQGRRLITLAEDAPSGALLELVKDVLGSSGWCRSRRGDHRPRRVDRLLRRGPRIRPPPPPRPGPRGLVSRPVLVAETPATRAPVAAVFPFLPGTGRRRPTRRHRPGRRGVGTPGAGLLGRASGSGGGGAGGVRRTPPHGAGAMVAPAPGETRAGGAAGDGR